LFHAELNIEERETLIILSRYRTLAVTSWRRENSLFSAGAAAAAAFSSALRFFARSFFALFFAAFLPRFSSEVCC
jgi:hypothetical protein